MGEIYEKINIFAKVLDSDETENIEKKLQDIYIILKNSKKNHGLSDSREILKSILNHILDDIWKPEISHNLQRNKSSFSTQVSPRNSEIPTPIEKSPSMHRTCSNFASSHSKIYHLKKNPSYSSMNDKPKSVITDKYMVFPI